jgi:murein tripeptide amidase MpaA
MHLRRRLKDYRAVASYDHRHWFRVPTEFDGQRLVISHMPERDSIYYAYFEPYSWERHLDLLAARTHRRSPALATSAAASRVAT